MQDRRVLLVVGVAWLIGLGGFIFAFTHTSTSPDRVVTCRILEEHISDGESSTWWGTDSCGPLSAPDGLISFFNGSYHAAIADLEVGHTYRIRVHDVKKLLFTKWTHVVQVEGEVP